MKKICIFFSLFFLFFESQNYQNNCLAMADVSSYAKVMKDCVLYKSSTLNNEIDNIYFIIPETYFVMIIDSVSDNCYKVQYGDYVGFVDSSKVIIATFTPVVKTLEEIFCDIKDNAGTQVWSKPSASSTIYATIPAGTKNIKYIATSYGEKPNGGESNIWYYVSYTPENNSTNVYEGYIYSENVTNLTEIISNTETNPEVIPDESVSDFALYISSPIKILLISIVSIPIIILFLILIHKITKKIQEKTKNKSENLQKNNFIADNSFNNDNFQQQHLRQEIQSMSEKPFVRKINRLKSNRYTNNYPSFPSYDSEDDLL